MSIYVYARVFAHVLGALSAAHGSQVIVQPPRTGRTEGDRYVSSEQCVVSVQRWATTQPQLSQQYTLMERRARPVQHGHLYWTHDTGKNNF